MIEEISQFTLGATRLRYLRDTVSGCVGMELVPAAMSDQVSSYRPGPDCPVESLAQLKRVGDPYPGGFAQGHTMRNAPSSKAFAFVAQRVEQNPEGLCVVTVLRSAEDHSVEHRLSWRIGDAALSIACTFTNQSSSPVQLEMFSSFSLAGLTPFHDGDSTGRLRVHRFRSGWSAEGRLDTQTIEQLHLERSWSCAGAFSERFGQVGTMPVRKWFPFVAVEDVVAGVLWGAQLAWAGSWQMEVYRQFDDLAISGGLADREFGHWMKTIQPGESFDAPVAMLACVSGDLDDLCDALTAHQQHAVELQPAVEQDLPLIFNEWCTTWGDPQHDRLVAIADRLKESATRYLVIDAGWYKTDGSDWSNGHGDWNPNSRLFPCGLEGAAQAIRERGLIPGLWFEMETVGSESTAFSLVDHLLQRDGLPVTSRVRRFWNLSDPWVVDYLAERVIGTLKKGGFGYLKVDYNETLGLGCDHPDSLGEGLRQQVLGSYRFFQKIRNELPDLVLENCASGGHRLEPSMLELSAMSSFSDAHESVEIPIIAANLHRLMLPRQSQIWAVLRRNDSAQRLAYSLAATFLGRMCLSGDITDLSPEQWALVLSAQAFYRQIAPVIKNGRSRRFGQTGEGWRHPTGWQAVRRESDEGRSLLVVIHAFADSPASVKIPLPGGSWRVRAMFPSGSAELDASNLLCALAGDFSAQVILLER